jgi:hypothetical protein
MVDRGAGDDTGVVTAMYAVRIIEEDALPTDHGWVLTRSVAVCALFIKRSALNSEVLAEVWAASEATKALDPAVCDPASVAVSVLTKRSQHRSPPVNRSASELVALDEPTAP